MDAAVADALSEDLTPSGLPVASPGQTYEELTEFNDRLRDENHWKEVDLDAALTPELVAKLDEWRSLQRIPWSTADIAAVGLAGMVGGTCIWFDTAIDRMIRQWLNPLNQTRLIQALRRQESNFQSTTWVPGSAAGAHRVKSAGHDLARPFAALRQIMDGQFEGIRWSFGERIPETKAFQPVQSFEEALLRWIMHLSADVLTPMSLPSPVSRCSTKATAKPSASSPTTLMREFAPRGLNLRSALVAPGMTAIATETVIRTHVHSHRPAGARIGGAHRPGGPQTQ